MRAGVWFHALHSTERAIVDLTIHQLERVRSATLAVALARVLGKMFRALRLRFWGPIQDLGYPLAEGLAAVAMRWGHPRASQWVGDRAYVRLLGLHARSAEAKGMSWR
jgi:hypothetical protein